MILSHNYMSHRITPCNSIFCFCFNFSVFLFFGRKKFQALRLMVLQMPIIQGSLLLLLNVFNAIDKVNGNFHSVVLHARTHTCTTTTLFCNTSTMDYEINLRSIFFSFKQNTAIIRSKPTDSNALHCSIDNDRRMGTTNHLAYDCQTLAGSQNHA